MIRPQKSQDGMIKAGHVQTYLARRMVSQRKTDFSSNL